MSLHVPSAPPASVPVAGVIPFSVAIDVPGARLTVSGELDRETAHHLTDAVGSLSGTARPRWVLDARQVWFCDAEGLRSVVAAHRAARRAGRELTVLPSPCVHRLVVLMGLEQLLGTPPATASVRTELDECRRARRSLAAVRELRRPSAVPDATPSPTG